MLQEVEPPGYIDKTALLHEMILFEKRHTNANTVWGQGAGIVYWIDQ
jgi:hypothetical protein